MICFDGAIIAKPQIARFVNPIHSPKDRVFQIGYGNETREKNTIANYFSSNQNIHQDFDQACQIQVPCSTCCTEKIVVHSHKIKSI
jgi:hypothetical protein